MQQFRNLCLLIIFAFTFFTAQSQNQNQKHHLISIEASLKVDDYKSLNEKFSSYNVFSFEENSLKQISSESSNFIELQLDIPQLSQTIELTKKEIFSDLYYGFDHITNEETEKPEDIYYAGYIKNTDDIARLTIDENFLLGLILLDNKPHYIEPVSRLLGVSAENTYIIYEPQHVLNSNSHTCGFDEVKGKFQDNLNSVIRLDNSTGGTECRLLEIAQAYDQGMLNRYNTNANLSTWNAAIWNVVDGLYDSQFTVDVDFVIITEAFAPAITTNTDITTYLNNFRTWGNSGGFGVPFDIGNLWTTIDVSGGGNTSVIGSVMEIAGVCGNSRYQIFEDFVGPTTVPPTGGSLSALAILIAHEVGHNLGMFHNDGPGANIMEPSLNGNAFNFSDVSKHYFESTLLAKSCYSTCFCIEIVNAEPTNCSADGSTHDLLVTIEHDNTGSFTLSAGGISTSYNYGGNPQTVTLAGVPSNITSISASDNNTAGCNFTATIDLPDDPNINNITTTYCSTDNMNVNLVANTSESYGSIIITLNADDFSSNEQTAQIIDRNGNVVVNYPFGTFANNNTVVVNSGPLNLDPLFAPYEVIVADWFGDGFGSSACQNTNGGAGSYQITDGQGNVIRATAGLQNSNNAGCTGNDAVIETTTTTPAVDNTVSGNWSGPGIVNGAADDGQATFNPSNAGVGTHFLDYFFNTYKGCVAERIIVTVSNCNSCSAITSVTSSNPSNLCDTGGGISVDYTVTVDFGVNGADYEIIWLVDGNTETATSDVLTLNLDPVDGCTPLNSPTVSAQVRCLSDGTTPNPSFLNTSSAFTIYPIPDRGVDFTMINNDCTVSINESCSSLIITNDQGTGASFTIPEGSLNTPVTFTIKSSNMAPVGCEDVQSLTAICPCPVFLNLTGPINNVQDYEASDYIESDQVLSNPGRVDYDAAKLITLKSGFIANTGVNFAAFIDGCNLGAGGFNLESEEIDTNK